MRLENGMCVCVMLSQLIVVGVRACVCSLPTEQRLHRHGHGVGWRRRRFHDLNMNASIFRGIAAKACASPVARRLCLVLLRRWILTTGNFPISPPFPPSFLATCIQSLERKGAGQVKD